MYCTCAHLMGHVCTYVSNVYKMASDAEVGNEWMGGESWV